uniref:JmjC domain-containing protein n=1 Tax=Tanacetum cinerariifolium TaxID=118510 RepID=A0A699K0M6_TANCI|nr:JmjC domain-containing protein [Tanacetum cinerariifolium]
MQKVHSLEAELHDHKRIFKDIVGNPCAHTDVPPGASAVHAATLVVPSGTSVVPAAALADPAGSLNVPDAASAVPAAASADPAGSQNILAAVTSSGALAGVSSKGKSPMVKDDIPVKARTFKQMEDDRLGEEVAKRLHDEELAQLERERAEAQRKRQQEVLDYAMYYYKSDWLNIRAQVKANAYLSKTLLGDDVFEDNFPARMAALIKKKRQTLAEQLFKERQNRPMTQAQQKAKSLGRKHMHKSKSTLLKLDLDAPAQTFLKVVVNEDSDDEDSNDEVWSAVVGWEVLPTPLGATNALYRIDGSTKHFATLRQILHMVDRQDLMKLYGLVVQYYETHHVAGAGMLFWGDLQVLFDSQAGERVLSMFTDASYPLSVKLMERMLMHKLEIGSDIVGNDLTTTEQLIQIIKNQLFAAQASSVS